MIFGAVSSESPGLDTSLRRVAEFYAFQRFPRVLVFPSPAPQAICVRSLFGRGAKMTAIPRINGTIALPTFDSSKMTIDEEALRASQSGKRSSENGEQ